MYEHTAYETTRSAVDCRDGALVGDTLSRFVFPLVPKWSKL